MTKLDRMIEDALKKEDRDLFAAQDELGFLGQVGGLFSGKLGWLSALTTAAQVGLFAGALFAAKEFLQASSAVDGMRWGGLAALLFFAMTVIKLMHWSQMQANRVIREVKRVELLLARGAAK